LERISSAIGALLRAIIMNFVQYDTGARLAISNMGADKIRRGTLVKKSKIFSINANYLRDIRKFFL
jgi:hypothetical protein